MQNNILHSNYPFVCAFCQRQACAIAVENLSKGFLQNRQAAGAPKMRPRGKMNSLIKTTIKRPVTICVLVVILLAVGVLATLDMSTNLLPNIAMPMMGITVVYPGASAQSVENDVTSLLENALDTVPGVKERETISYDNVSIAILTFDYGTDIDEKIDFIEDTLKTVDFPGGCNDPAFIKIDMNGTATATIAVYNAEGDVDALAANANALATRMRAIEGVGSVDVFGTAENEIKITALEGLDITSLLIVQALSNENLDIPLGTIMQDGTSVSIRNASDAKSLLQVMQIPATMELSNSVLSSLTSLKSGVKMYATCTLQEFYDYVQKARDARAAMDEIEGKTAAELEEQQNSLSGVKSLMSLVRENSSQTLRLMWHTIDTNLVQNKEFVDMSEEDLEALSEQMNMSVGTLKWLQEGAKNGTLKEDWDKLVNFRAIFPTVDDNGDGELTGDDITYDQFAMLFQNGGSVVVETTAEDGTVTAETKTFAGLDLLHSAEAHEGCDESCDKEIFSHEEAADVCQFADSVNTVAYGNIVDTVREAEEKLANGETVEQPVISDAQFAALFTNSTQGNDFAALLSPQVIHVIRQENFDNGEGSIVDILTKSKLQHVCVDEGENYGKPIYKNGKILARNDNNEIVVTINGKEFLVNNFGRLTDQDGKLVDEQGNLLTLTDQQIAANYYSYGSYVIYFDQELLDLYAALETDADFGITPTADTARFVRICNFSENANKLIVPVAYLGHVEEYENKQSFASYNGLIAATVKVYAVSDANTSAVVREVKKVLADSSYSSKVLLLDDKAQFIGDSITNVLSSILIGGVLAVLVIYLFVRKIGSSLVVSITMPLSVLVALIGLWAMNISLNMVSLGGLAVGIGMLVDNSIVVLESITKRRDEGESVFDSCLNGTKEVAGSLLASTLTNVCVFFPILFANGLTKEIFSDLVWAVLFSIVMSLIVAVTVIPSLYHLVYRNSNRPRYKRVNGQKVLVGNYEELEPRQKDIAAKETSKGETYNKQDKRTQRAKARLEKVRESIRNPQKAVHKMEKGYGKILSKVLTQRVAVCVVALVVFGASVGLVFTTGMEFMPSVDKGLIEINMNFASGATLDESELAGTTAAKKITERYGEGVQYVSLTVGKQGMLATNITNVLRVQLDTSKLNTKQTVQEIRQLLSEAQLGVKNFTVTDVDGVVAEVTGGMSGQSVTLLSDNMDVLAEAAGKVASKLEAIDGIASVTNNTAQKTEQISFAFDKEECANRGVDYQNAVLMLRVGLSGHTAANVSIQGESQNVNVEFAKNTKNDLNSILNVVVGFDDNGAVKLSDVLKKSADGKPYATDYVVTAIDKQNGKFVTTIDVESHGVDTGTLSKRIAAAVAEVLDDYPNVQYKEGGVASYLSEAFNGLVVSLIAAFLLLYGVMACQFESLIKPFIVIMSIPFSFTGGFLALVITGTPLSVVSFVGLIMLMGVIVNGAIVMIDKIDQLISEGMDPREAVLEGCKSRLRPILMTTLTTVLALVPLALGLGRGGELMQPMGIVVIGGLLLGTTVTLVLIPCFYCIVKRISFKNLQQQVQTAEDSLQTGDAESVCGEAANEVLAEAVNQTDSEQQPTEGDEERGGQQTQK